MNPNVHLSATRLSLLSVPIRFSSGPRPREWQRPRRTEATSSPPRRARPRFRKLTSLVVPWDGGVRSQRYKAWSGDAAFGQLLQSAPASVSVKAFWQKCARHVSPLRVGHTDLLAYAELPLADMGEHVQRGSEARMHFCDVPGQM